MSFEMFRESRSAARQALMKQQRLLVHEAERDEFGEASGFILNLAQEPHLADPVLRRFSMSIHHRGSGADAVAMRSANDFDPLRGGEFVARENVANFVVENFCGRAGQRA